MNQQTVDFLTEFICESEAIEGHARSREGTRLQILGGKKDGHVGALLFLDDLAERRGALKEADISAVQGLIIKEQNSMVADGGLLLHPCFIGKYRKVDVQVGRDVPPPAKEVPHRMLMYSFEINGLLAGYKHFSCTKRVEEIAVLHHSFMKIHPFRDGNGRTARALSYYFLKRCRFNDARIQPFVFTSRDREEEYYPCFWENSPQTTRKYFLKRTRCPQVF